MSLKLESPEVIAGKQFEQDMQEWSRQLDAFAAGEQKTKDLIVGGTPDVLQRLGFPDYPVIMQGKDVAKVLSDREDHCLPMEQLRVLPQALWEPVMIFKSASKTGAYTILTEIKNPVDKRNVMIALHHNVRSQRVRVNRIASAYTRRPHWYVG
ncbi:hypothetical protein [Halodesulfovibrio sp.]|jgi:hypothetical protein|uniref:MuF-C-terminal domain-containing protein n=1 Tax=Halodesulfovibrio sp. TaxID=1912772 RepID=UPI0025DD3624|nr:hypothetical protein [Halodesulfovibrio sp.]MCT4626448.1 hypothetical protein [Halodesulfovibrio sp.]